jgi:hypothetical protein
VQVEKSEVTSVLRKKGAHDRAQQAECSLPRHVDTERDASLLHRFDVTVSELNDDDGE